MENNHIDNTQDGGLMSLAVLAVSWGSYILDHVSQSLITFILCMVVSVLSIINLYLQIRKHLKKN